MNNKSELEIKKKKQKYTCHWPIYEGEEIWKSTTGETVRSGSSTTYQGGLTDLTDIERETKNLLIRLQNFLKLC